MTIIKCELLVRLRDCLSQQIKNNREQLFAIMVKVSFDMHTLPISMLGFEAGFSPNSRFLKPSCCENSEGEPAEGESLSLSVSLPVKWNK